MAKINILFDGTTYHIDESALETPIEDLKAYLSFELSGTGATIRFGGNNYNVDATKLSNFTSTFVTYLQSIAGDGLKVVIGGVEYGVDSNRVSGAVTELENTLNTLSGGEPKLAPGLYNAEGTMIASWNDLLTNNILTVQDNALSAINKAFEGDLVVSNDVTKINVNAFSHCANLTTINLPNDITFIGGNAFKNCTSLRGIIIPDKVTFIGSGAFLGCYSLSEAVIGNGVSNLYDTTFENCTALTKIKFTGTITQWNSVNKRVGWNRNVPATKVICTDGTVTL